MKKVVVSLLAVAVALLFAVSCGKEDRIKSLTLSLSDRNVVRIGFSVSLTASASAKEGEELEYEWTSSAPGIISLEADGLNPAKAVATAHSAGMAEVSVVVKTKDAAAFKEARVMFKALQGISISGAADEEGAVDAASILDDEGKAAVDAAGDVVWEVSGDGAAFVDIDPDTGLVTLKPGADLTKAGSTITITAKSGGRPVASVEVDVPRRIAAESVSVRLKGGDGAASGRLQLSAGSSVLLEATVLPYDCTDAVLWSVVSGDDGESDAAGSVSSDGVLTASGLLGSKARVMASAGDAHGFFPFSVKGDTMKLPDPEPDEESDYAPIVMQTGSSPSFSISVPAGKSLAQDSPFVVSPAGSGVFVSQDGTVTIVNPDGAIDGKLFEVTANYSDGTSQIMEVIIGSEILPSSITILPAGPKEFVLGDPAAASLALVADIAPEGVTYGAVFWETTDEETVSVDQDGNIVPVAVGRAQITVSSVKYPDVASIPIDVRVRYPEVKVQTWDSSLQSWKRSAELSAPWNKKLSDVMSSADIPPETFWIDEDGEREPFVFDCWCVSDALGTNPSTYDGRTVGNVDFLDEDGKTVYAKYKLKEYDVSFLKWDANRSEWVKASDDQRVVWGGTFSAPDEPAAIGEYVFAGWALFDSDPAGYSSTLPGDGNVQYVPDSTPVKSDLKLYARYAPGRNVVWKYRYVNDTGTVSAWADFGSPAVFPYGMPYVAPMAIPDSISKNGRTLYFNGWVACDSAPADPFQTGALVLPASGSYSNSYITSDITLYAAYAETSYLSHMKTIPEVSDFSMQNKIVAVSAFEISELEITQEAWKDVWDWVADPDHTDRRTAYYRIYNDGDSNPSYFDGSEGRVSDPAEQQKERPIESVTWYVAVEFCNAISAMSGLEPCYSFTGSKVACDWHKSGFRLPTETEWEYAASGGSYQTSELPSSGAANVYSGGSAYIFDYLAWYAENSNSKTHESGIKNSNGWGLFDMTGNVMEWCWDWKDEAYGSAVADWTAPVLNYHGPLNGSWRVCRGGHWNSSADDCMVSVRSYETPSVGHRYIGLRLARSVFD